MNATSTVLQGRTRLFVVRLLSATLLISVLPVLGVVSRASAITPTILVVTTQPSGASNGLAFTTPVAVSAEDGSGNVDTTYSGAVTVSFATGSGTLANVSVNAVSGVATFSSLTITGLVGLYSLSFAALVTNPWVPNGAQRVNTPTPV